MELYDNPDKIIRIKPNTHRELKLLSAMLGLSMSKSIQYLIDRDTRVMSSRNFNKNHE